MASQQRSTQILSTTLKKTTKLLDNTPIKEYYTKFYKNQEKILHSISIDYPEKDTINPYSIIDDNQVENGFVAAIQQAYNHHQHLRISPDDVWLAIAQGVSNHINNNAERFRYYFVKHEGQKEICIFAGDILSTENNQLKGDWPVAINRLTTKVDENVTKVDLSKTLECDFSTSTSASITASRVILLDSMKKYFKYKIMCMCGIPKVTLEGSLQDWQKLQEKVVKLRELGLDMDFWLDRLEPVIWKLVETYRGNIDQDFWSKVIMSKGGGSGMPVYWDGWISAFFPYDNTGHKLTKNSIEAANIPKGQVNVPFDTDIGFVLSFVAGFLGAQQESFGEGDETEVIVSPVIGWLVVDQIKD